MKTTLQTAYQEVEAAKKEGRFGFPEEKNKGFSVPIFRNCRKRSAREPAFQAGTGTKRKSAQ
jgi:hypothetical protein